MEFKFVILCMALWAFAETLAATIPPEQQEADGGDADVEDNDVAESSILSTLSALQSSQSSNANNLDVGNAFPYEGVRENLYETFAVPDTNLGLSINTRAVLAPQVEVLRLLEDFITLSSDIIQRLHTLFTENYELIRLALNIIVSKVTNLQAFSVKGISILRKILEFALNIFSNFSITLPSITLGSTQSMFAPHETYGVPLSSLNSTNLFQQN